ncbi:polysaccharide export protein [Komagataeibacter melaceti]|uniref:Polysaccharide export protein n=1 Tax=Komagataeibacter melaceti TaxID=2766577 RepID=A0A371YYE2_9PROT|nr:polysaccharide biosynthesis/export family protein [Komagataeibacter melaceti]RFD19256.1 polysaccharide export protein [Komagataeibacter melaceti]
MMILGLGLAGCNTLPNSGPTESEFKHAQKDPKKNSVGYGIVQISPDLITLLNSEKPPSFSMLANDVQKSHPNDRVGPGDSLDIAIYEMGVGVFTAGSPTSAPSSTAKPTMISAVPVDGNGDITLPYIGLLHVSGLTSEQIESEIQQRLKGKSQSPQVMVKIQTDLENSVIVYGGVKRSGRIPLTLHQERLIDAIALAGGNMEQPEDVIVRLERHGNQAETSLRDLEEDPTQNILLQAGDRIQLIREPRTFTAFGAAHQVTETPFNTSSVNLAEALARVGGPSDSQADPNAIFLFRYENADIAQRLGLPVTTGETKMPIVYQLDMINPASYFLAEHFPMKNKDVLYIANAKTNKLGKAFNLINTLMSPGMSAGRVSH